MTMTPETLAALRGSIAKWQAIVDGTGSDKGSRNCPLCAVFYYDLSCKSCPVMNHTGQRFCHDSPYEKWIELAPYNYDTGRLADTPEKVAAARAELDFLRSLLPEDQR